jgi:hypothetical protein
MVVRDLHPTIGGRLKLAGAVSEWGKSRSASTALAGSRAKPTPQTTGVMVAMEHVGLHQELVPGTTLVLANENACPVHKVFVITCFLRGHTLFGRELNRHGGSVLNSTEGFPRENDNARALSLLPFRHKQVGLPQDVLCGTNKLVEQIDGDVGVGWSPGASGAVPRVLQMLFFYEYGESIVFTELPPVSQLKPIGLDLKTSARLRVLGHRELVHRDRGYDGIVITKINPPVHASMSEPGHMGPRYK